MGRGRVIEARCREVCHPLQNGLSHSPAGAGYSPYGQTRRSPSKEAQGPFHSNPQQLPGLRLEAELVRLEDGATAAGECPGERTENEGGSLSWRGGGTRFRRGVQQYPCTPEENSVYRRQTMRDAKRDGDGCR